MFFIGTKVEVHGFDFKNGKPLCYDNRGNQKSDENKAEKPDGNKDEKRDENKLELTLKKPW